MKLIPTLPWLCLFAVSTATYADSIDLHRIDPVAATESIPVADFFRRPSLTNPKLNLAGTRITALISGTEDHTVILIYDLNSKTQETQGVRGDQDIIAADWLNNDRVIYNLTGSGMFAANVGYLTDARAILQQAAYNLLAVPPEDRTHPLVQLLPEGINTSHHGKVVTLDTDSSSAKTLYTDNTDWAESNQHHIMKQYPELGGLHGFDVAYIADKMGKPALGFTQDDGLMSLNWLDGDHWTKSPVNVEETDVVDCGDNPGEMVVLGPRNGQPRPLEFMQVASGQVGDVLLQDKAYDFDGWLYRDPLSHNIVGVYFDTAIPRTVWFTPAYRLIQKSLNAAFPGKVVSILGTSEDGKMVLFSVASDVQPPIYWWWKLDDKTNGVIKESRPWIDPKRMRPMSLVKFKTDDGRTLDAYLTLPAGASKQNPPPLVVLPHRYEFQRDTWQFNEEVQFFASRGYAVLQPNYRGSTGYGWMFPTDDQWAYRKMSDDVTAATRFVVAKGLVDPRRVAIVGTSFGGYLALAGAAFAPDLYRCAVAISATPDWGRFIRESKYNQYTDPNYSRLLAKLGDPDREKEKFAAMSPVAHADQIRAAILSVRSEFDPAYVTSSSSELVSIVSRNHVATDTMTFANETDGVRHLRNKVELYSRIEDFLAKNMGPGGAAP